MRRIKLFERFDESEMNQELIDLILKDIMTLTKEERSKIINIPSKIQNKVRLDNGFIAYNAIDDGEHFILIAKDLEDAKAQAALWNAEIKDEAKNYKP